MSRTTESRTIDGLECKCQKLQARRAARLAARLVRMIGPLFAQIAARNIDPEANALLMLGPVSDALAKLEDKDLEWIQTELLAGISVLHEDVKKQRIWVEMSNDDAIDMVFTGRLKTMFLAMKFAAEVNFADFWSGNDQATPEIRPSEA